MVEVKTAPDVMIQIVEYAEVAHARAQPTVLVLMPNDQTGKTDTVLNTSNDQDGDAPRTETKPKKSKR